jgi:CP family cyanate transporter-like MFS transporter
VLTAGLIIAIVLAAANLRATLTGVGTLLPMISHDTGLSSVGAGLLNTLPLLTFAVTSPFVGRASRKLGSTRLLVLAFGVLIVGTAIRSLPTLACLFAGTVVLSAAIACGNVLLPAIIRHSVPTARIGAMSSLYVTVMSLIAAVSSGISVPLARVLPGGWRSALAWGVVLVLVALAVWIPRLRGSAPASTPATAHSATPWRSWLAWQVSFFMGLQSLAFYTSIAWLPSILIGHGASATDAGWLLFFYQMVALVSAIAVPFLSRGSQDQRWLAAASSLLVATGFLALLTVPGVPALACTLLGLGAGAAVVLALTFQSHRADDSHQAASLAGMAQSIGYLVAATGPLLLGILHDRLDDWTLPLIVLIVFSLAMSFFGYGAGRDARVKF